jgi:predicted RND superfamily exporter protein
LENDGQAFKTDDRAKQLRKVFAGYTHNMPLDAAGIVCLLDNASEASVPTRETLAELRDLVNALPEGALVGEPVLIGEAFDLLEEDGRRLNTWSLGLLLLTIFICFRQLRWLILPLVIVEVSLAMTRGILVILDLELSMVSSMLAAIVTVVGISAIVHFIVQFRDELGRGSSPQEALERTTAELAAPLFFSCLTDAMGFAALTASSVKPVADFGLMMSIACLMILVAIALTAPGIILWPGHKLKGPPTGEDAALHTYLHRVYDWSVKHSKALGIAALLVTVLSFIGNGFLKQDTDFTHNFRQESELVQGYQFVDSDFGGAGVWDILIPAPARISKQFVMQVLEFEKQLLEQAPGLTKAISLADMLDAGAGGLDKLSFGGDMAVRGGLSLVRGRLPHFVAAIYNPYAPAKERYFRVMLRASERLDSETKAQLVAKVKEVTAATFPKAEVTGYYVLLTRLIEGLLRDQWATFAIATASILLVMVWAFKSVPLALMAMIPNALPIFWLFGAMGWLGMQINMGAAMIAAASLGMSVEGSIHYIMAYQRLRREGQSRDDALKVVQSNVGRAAVLATLALMVGFATLCFSEFIPTVYFGTLTTLTMIGGLVGNLMVLPLLLRVVER